METKKALLIQMFNSCSGNSPRHKEYVKYNLLLKLTLGTARYSHTCTYAHEQTS